MATLLLAIHNHQPIGNLTDVFAMAFRRCYAPMLEIFARHPAVHVAFHYSGPLLEWIEAHEPGHLRDLERQVASGQIELLGGGFYEPLLAAVPARDARGQVAMLSDYWERRTGVRPRGFWLTERIWEPSLPAVLEGSGLAYTLVDDAHLRHAGRLDTRFSGYFMTEKAGVPLALFPIDKQLRYLIPFAPAEEVIAHLVEQPADVALTYGDDGEKFGVWPHTYEWVIEKGWLDRFLGLLTRHQDRIQTATPGEYLTTHPPSGRVYLPTAAYDEMMEWALPAGVIPVYRDLRRELETCGTLERYDPFVMGGTWDNFLVKYPESNQMHKRMLLVSERLAAVERACAPAPLLAEARRALYQSQCNCAYWHGLFGGLYVNYLRHATYAQMIRADRLLDNLTGADGVDGRATDYDCDGHREFVVSTPTLLAIVRPDSGGALAELDWKPGDFNVLNTIARRREAYHERLSERPEDRAAARESRDGIPSIHELHERAAAEPLGPLPVDRHLRHSFLDHLWRPDATLDALEAADTTDLYDLSGAAYHVQGTHSDSRTWEAALVWQRGDLASPDLTLHKRYTVRAADSSIAAAYSLRHGAPTPRAFWFAVQFNFALLAGDTPDRYLEFEPAGAAGPPHPVASSPRRLASRGVVERLVAVSLVDEHSRFRIRLASSLPFDLWHHPVETLSQSESGYERTYQESALYCHWRPTLEPMGSFDPALTLTLSPLP